MIRIRIQCIWIHTTCRHCTIFPIYLAPRGRHNSFPPPPPAALSALFFLCMRREQRWASVVELVHFGPASAEIKKKKIPSSAPTKKNVQV